MTAEEIMEKIERARKDQGLTCADMDEESWHSHGCYSAMHMRIQRGGGLVLRNLMRYAEMVGLEIAIRKKKGD